MDGSYNQPFGHGHQPLQSPQTPPTSATYQVNVNRQKTRKWVEARKQTYDGDDWGADDFEDTSGQTSMPAQPEYPMSSRLPSYARETQASPRPSPDTPITRDPVPDSTDRHWSPVTASPGDAGTAPDSTTQLDGQDHSRIHDDVSVPPAAAELPDGRDSEAAADTTGGSGAVYRKNTTRKPVGSAGRPAEAIAGQVPGAGSMQNLLSLEQNLTTNAGPASVLTNAEQRAETKINADAEEEESDGKLALAEGAASEGLDQGQPHGPPDSSESPKLPDVARMSAFGTDLFLGNEARKTTSQQIPETSAVEEQLQARTYVPQQSSQTDALVSTSEKAQISQPLRDVSASQAPRTAPTTPSADLSADRADEPRSAGIQNERVSQVEGPQANADHPSQHWRPSVPGENPIARHERSLERDVSPVSEHSSSRSAGAPSTANKQKKPEEAGSEIAPLQTLVPQVENIPSDGHSHTSEDPGRPAKEIAPNEPSGSAAPESSLPDYEVQRLDRAPTFSTVASSPLKESDILRDEIIRSLSPRDDSSSINLTAPPEHLSDRLKGSTITGDTHHFPVQGSSWTDRPYTEPHEEATVVKGASGSVVGSNKDDVNSSTENERKQTPPQGLRLQGQDERSQLDDRRRFSWEAESGSAQAQAKGILASTIAPSGESSAFEIDESDIGSRQEPPNRTQTLSGVTQIPSDREQSGATSPAQASPRLTQHQSLEPDSDHQRSPHTEQHSSTPAIKEESQPSQIESGHEQHLSENIHNAISQPSPLHVNDASIGDAFSPSGSGSVGQLMTFREIMGMPSPLERISKYDDARLRFASVDSGLHDWISELKASQPDHANIGPNYASAVHSMQHNQVTSSMSGQTPAQQPYYQQYLNASSPSANVPSSSTRSRLAHLPQSAQAAGSAFGHSSNQIGTKGKELMQSAGKMGKGLFSKGKSKLRGTGDKGDISPPVTPVKGRAKADRRSSWALNFGNRSRTADTQPLSSGTDRSAYRSFTYHSRHPSSATGQSSLAGRRLSVDTAPLRESMSHSGESEIDHVQRNASVSVIDSEMPATSSFLRKDADHSRTTSLPLTIESHEEPKLGFSSDAADGQHDFVHQDHVGAREIDRTSGDWVVVSRENAVVAQDSEVVTPTGNDFKRTDEGEDNSTFTEPSGRPEVLKRDPSFGLPQIKRTATLDLGFSDAFEPIGKKQDSQGASPDLSMNDKEGQGSGDHPDSESALVVRSKNNQRLDGPLPPIPNSGYPLMAMQHASGRGTSSSSSLAQANLPRLQTQSPPQQDEGVQILPAGPWKLEESHLSAPLHQVSRKRSGTSESQQFTYGLDKETGLTSPASPTSPQTAIPSRQRAINNLPPSSAQRYPELFTSNQIQYHQPESINSGKHDAPNMKIPHVFPRSQSNELGSSGAAALDNRGRRKSSGIFKEFGHRFTRAASRERRGSQTEPRQEPSEVLRPDGASEVSIWSENVPGRSRNHSSHLPASRDRHSLDMTSADPVHQFVSRTSTPPARHLGTTSSHGAQPLDPEDERKTKVFSAVTSSMDRLKLKSSHTLLQRGPEQKPGEQDSKGTHVKSTLSDIGNKVVGMTGALRRLNNDHSMARKTPRVMDDDPREQVSGYSARGTTPAIANSLNGSGNPYSSAATLPLAPTIRDEHEQSHAPQTSYLMDRSDKNQIHPSKPSLTAAVGHLPQSSQTASEATNPGQPPEEAKLAQAPARNASDADVANSARVSSQEPESQPGMPVQLTMWNTTHQRASFAEPNSQPVFPRADTGLPDQRSATSKLGHHTSGVLHDAEPVPPSSGEVHLHHDHKAMSVNVWPPQGHPAMQPASTDHAHQPPAFRSPSNGQLDFNAPSSRQSATSLSRGSSQDRPYGFQNNLGGNQQGSKWKGFRTRISGHMSQFSVKQSKADRTDKTAGTKLLGAFKRNSRLHENRLAEETLHPDRRRQTSDYPDSQEHLTTGQRWSPNTLLQVKPVPHLAYQEDRQTPHRFEPPSAGPGIVDDHRYQPPSTTSRKNSTPMQLQHQDQPTVLEAHSSLSAEKQYEKVPIPRAYGIVRGDGSPSTAMTNPIGPIVGHPAERDYSARDDALPRLPAFHQQPISERALTQQAQPSKAPQTRELTSKQVANGSGEEVPLSRNQVATLSRNPQKDDSAALLPDRMADRTHDGFDYLPHPTSPQVARAGRPDYPREDSQVLPSLSSTSVNTKPTKGQESAGGEPQTDPEFTAERGTLNSLSVDVAKAQQEKDEDIYDATPRVVQHETGDMQPKQGSAQSSTSRRSDQGPSAIVVQDPQPNARQQDAETKPKGASVVMELEDTEEARKRTLRLDAQEEKIYYDPADDDDMPKMSATAYPSDAWEPYYYYGD